MKENFAKCLVALLKHEGGYVHNKNDPGGRTNLGVTQRAWEEYLGRSVTEDEMRALTPDVVTPFYKTKYWDACKCDELPSGVDYCVFDTAVNSGPKRAAVFLQRALGVADDGKIGPGTLAAVAKADPVKLVEDYCDQRLDFMKEAKNSRTGELLWPFFGRGWSRRVSDVNAVASAMTSV